MKIGIHLHLYYLDQWEFFRKQLEHIGGRHGYDKILIITTSKEKKEEARKMIKGYPCNIYGLENRGYDVAPFIFALNKLKKWKPDIVLKLQTKGNKGSKTQVYLKGKFYKNALEWRTRQVKGILGSKRNVEKIIKKFQDETIGMIGTTEFLREKCRTARGNYGKFKKIFDLKDISHPFFAGTMFWLKWEVCEELISKLKFNDYEIVNIKKGDRALAHATEHYLGNVVNKLGLKTHCIDDTFFNKLKFRWKKLVLFKKILRIFVKVKNNKEFLKIRVFGILVYKKNK